MSAVFVPAGPDEGLLWHRGEPMAEQRAIVEGVAVVAKHAKPSAKNPQGGIEKKEAPIHIAKLNVLDSKTGKATRVGHTLK